MSHDEAPGRAEERLRVDVAVIGAGAAGLMAAIHARGPAGGPGCDPAHGHGAGPRPRVLVVEGTRDGGRKILISGGGRCNILPGDMDESRFVTDSSPNTLRKILRSWPQEAQRRFFEEELGIRLALERESGKLFPASGRARDVRDALVSETRVRGAGFLFDTRVTRLERAGGADAAVAWVLRTSRGPDIEARAVVVATGGLSVPNTGSDGAGLAMLRRLGCAMQPTFAALTPLTCDPPLFRDLAGVSLDVTLRAPGPRKAFVTHGGFLFTHRGYSGPAVLDVSHLAVRSLEDDGTRQKILVQWTALEEADWERELAPRRAGVAGVLKGHLPSRLAERLQAEAGVPADRSLAELRSGERRSLVETLTRFELPWTGHEGYRTAEVTGGGLGLAEVDPRTLEVRREPGLFACGEILDAFGPIGGYNFAWAWATGRAAGLGAAASACKAREDGDLASVPRSR